MKIVKSFFSKNFVFLAFLAVVVAGSVLAEAVAGEGAHDTVITLLWIVVILLSAKIASLVERFGQPSVLGELLIGVILGNLILLGITVFEPIKSDIFIPFLAELG